jgi:hypothetical protein
LALLYSLDAPSPGLRFLRDQVKRSHPPHQGDDVFP